MIKHNDIQNRKNNDFTVGYGFPQKIYNPKVSSQTIYTKVLNTQYFQSEKYALSILPAIHAHPTIVTINPNQEKLKNPYAIMPGYVIE